MNNAQKIAEEIDLVTEGFERVPVVARPPKIKWGEGFQEWDDAKKIQYLMKFAESMNHAAAAVQDERDKLNTLLERKERQIIQLHTMLDGNNRMLQSEITKMNAYKQDANAYAMKLQARIKELENGNTDRNNG